MTDRILRLGEPGAARELARVILDARRLVGWSQAELASRAGASQAALSRLERGRNAGLDLDAAGRFLAALGMTGDLAIRDVHLRDRERQVDAVHSVMSGYIARRLERWQWLPVLEAQVGDRAPRGWIDLVAYRAVDRSLLVEETKSDIPDMGGLQRSLTFYQSMAWEVARGLGWRPARIAVLVVALDSETVAGRLADNRQVVARAFPERVGDVAAWLADPARPAPRRWTLGACDPASRERAWLRPTTLGSRRRPPAYRDYADAAARLVHSR
jgi:transcriptional regulator with XRE-family HTH domain